MRHIVNTLKLFKNYFLELFGHNLIFLNEILTEMGFNKVHPSVVVGAAKSLPLQNWDKKETLLLFYPNFVMERISWLQTPQMDAPC